MQQVCHNAIYTVPALKTKTCVTQCQLGCKYTEIAATATFSIIALTGRVLVHILLDRHLRLRKQDGLVCLKLEGDYVTASTRPLRLRTAMPTKQTKGGRGRRQQNPAESSQSNPKDLRF
jgi:hypothetical protein